MYAKQVVEPKVDGEDSYVDWCIVVIEAGLCSCDGCGGHLVDGWCISCGCGHEISEPTRGTGRHDGGEAGPKDGVYQLDDPAKAAEFVKDVAGFANAKAGGHRPAEHNDLRGATDCRPHRLGQGTGGLRPRDQPEDRVRAASRLPERQAFRERL